MADASSYVHILAGDPAPWFHQRTSSNPRYAFDTAAGRYLVLCFYGSAEDESTAKALAHIQAAKRVFDDKRAAFFGIGVDPADEAEARVADHVPGFRFIWDFDAKVSRLYGSAPKSNETNSDGSTDIRRLWVVIDPTMRVIRTMPFVPGLDEVQSVIDYVAGLPAPEVFAGFAVPPPILVLPNVFEPEFCRRLMAVYDETGGEETGFMREVDGKTVSLLDHRHKRRRDATIESEDLRRAAQARFIRRIVPEIQKVHHFKVTRMERYIVACYAAEDEAHFHAHRDNSTKGTAHRRFAVSVNLNEDFEGGEVSFPEYGPRGFKAPAGGAVVFSCSLLHAVSRVTRGRRYAFLPFLYDDEAAKVREANNAFLGEGVGAYKSG